LLVLLQGRQRHVIEGEQREDQERDQQEMEPDLPPEAPRRRAVHHQYTSFRTNRSCAYTTSASTGNRYSEIAAPSPIRPYSSPASSSPGRASVANRGVEFPGPPWVST